MEFSKISLENWTDFIESVAQHSVEFIRLNKVYMHAHDGTKNLKKLRKH